MEPLPVEKTQELPVEVDSDRDSEVGVESMVGVEVIFESGVFVESLVGVEGIILESVSVDGSFGRFAKVFVKFALAESLTRWR